MRHAEAVAVDDDYGDIIYTSQAPGYKQEELEVESVRLEQLRRQNSFLRAAEALLETASLAGSHYNTHETDDLRLQLITFFCQNDFPLAASELTASVSGISSKLSVYDYALSDQSLHGIDLIRQLGDIQQDVFTRAPRLMSRLACIHIKHGVMVNENIALLHELSRAMVANPDKYYGASYNDAFPTLHALYVKCDFTNLVALAGTLTGADGQNFAQHIDAVVAFEKERKHELDTNKHHFRHRLAVFNYDSQKPTVDLRMLKKILTEIDSGNKFAVSAFWSLNRYDSKVTPEVRCLLKLMTPPTVNESNAMAEFRKKLTSQNPQSAIAYFERYKVNNEAKSNEIMDMALQLAQTFPYDPREEALFALEAKIELLTQTMPTEKDRLVRSRNLLGEISLVGDSDAEFMTIASEAYAIGSNETRLRAFLKLTEIVMQLQKNTQERFRQKLIQVADGALKDGITTMPFENPNIAWACSQITSVNYFTLEQFITALQTGDTTNEEETQ